MLTDHVMPGMTGVELASASRQLRPLLPILLATGYAELSEATQLDLPRLAKPYHQDQLRDRLDQLLGGDAHEPLSNPPPVARSEACL
jgi:CheY-like chemotaxis protein